VAIDAELRKAVGTWIANDPDPRDQEELRALHDRAEHGDDAAAVELRDRFAGRLTFGTAGLRGAVGAGPNRMNRAVVRAATAAVAGWLRDAGTGHPPAAVVGCDARHRSDEFADEAARALAGAGIEVHLLPRPSPTPLLAFAVRHLAVQAGIMITASHNPATDNGYKLYLSDGAQIIPPMDARIEDRITLLGPLAAIPVASLDSPLITRHGDEIAEAYLDAIVPSDEGAGGQAQGQADAAVPRIVYTPMHGVAGDLLLRAVRRAGFPAPHVVAAQGKPDPDFPTVAFPNPEEPGALDLALADARVAGADLVLASDPDGDRLAIAVPVHGANESPDEWRQLSGDQVGALLGAYLLRAETGSPDTRTPLVASTIVSSTLLSKIAAAAGARYAQTLTGFKWIARAGDDQPGTKYVFGYEEALGYQAGQAVRDKDGIGAAIAVLRMTAAARAAGRGLGDEYDALEQAHGVHLTQQLSLRILDPDTVMRRIRGAPPREVGGFAVNEITDYINGSTCFPPSDVLSYSLDGARLVIRPSGTEPKIKAYLEVVEPVRRDLGTARENAAARMAPLRAAVEALLAPQR
jgi:phosphomannomutase